jgi:sarcosine oxidase delta subunit
VTYSRHYCTGCRKYFNVGRIETAQELAEAIAAWERSRNEARTRIEWSFRVADARKKLHWIYPS